MILNLAFGPNRRLSERETVSVGEHTPNFSLLRQQVVMYRVF